MTPTGVACLAVDVRRLARSNNIIYYTLGQDRFAGAGRQAMRRSPDSNFLHPGQARD
jgi:hypothetical protein